MTIRAIYAGGVLRPLQTLGLAEGQEVDINVQTLREHPGPDSEYIERILTQFASEYEPTEQPETAGIDHDMILYGGDSSGTELRTTRQKLEMTAPDPRKAAEAVAAIAAMPIEAGGEVFSGEDHDRILYGEHGAR